MTENIDTQHLNELIKEADEIKLQSIKRRKKRPFQSQFKRFELDIYIYRLQGCSWVGITRHLNKKYSVKKMNHGSMKNWFNNNLKRIEDTYKNEVTELKQQLKKKEEGGHRSDDKVETNG